eukprot:817130-Pleurochrysis_carterae.AAC.1
MRAELVRRRSTQQDQHDPAVRPQRGVQPLRVVDSGRPRANQDRQQRQPNGLDVVPEQGCERTS